MKSSAKHSEILFLWDAKMCNPNGDMLNDNAPRFDEMDSKAIVSDVRVKRTIRDDLQDRKNETIFVNNPEIVQSAESRFLDIKDKSKESDRDIFLSCLDNRLFGGVAPKSNIQVIGAVQFSWSKTLNETEPILSQGTGAFGKDKTKEKIFKKTFRTDNYIPYGLFAMYGTVNKNSALKSKATEEDIENMLDSLWYGTKLLNTRSKEGQKPRLTVRVIYKEDTNYMIGLLDELVELKNENSETIRSFKECDIDFNELTETLNDIKDRVEKIVIYYDRSAKKYLEEFQKLDIDIETIQG